ncbi:nicotinate-nucleotide--dimethylbenzimidazole phosphoribosyltransferase [Streptomyces sp. L2]|uniref:nicotinate-nucleotide--dimethylbenzimidazole phosphoribosyltransferase n=1 Tax=Streptomyces sp. L2 TaxID=2162665 RepID=UPI0010102D8B|nr:nicotinate-nucleotide--dimethylbenzimidazole phosphoribosyltransferase [Streptomyces sp. L2]
MTDTGQVPGEGLPESAGMVEQPGVPAHGAYTYLSDAPAEDEELLLPGAQGAWGNEVPPPAPEPVVEAVHEPGPHETAGRDSGSVDLTGVRLPDSGPVSVTPSPILSAPHDPGAAVQQPRRPLHLGPPIPDTSASPVRSLADRGPAGTPVRQPGLPTGPEYAEGRPPLHDMAPQSAAPWGTAPDAAEQAPAEQAAAQVPVGVAQAQGQVPAAVAQVEAQVPAAETVAPAGPAATETPGAAEAAVARLTHQASAAAAQGQNVVHGHDGMQPANAHDGVQSVESAQSAAPDAVAVTPGTPVVAQAQVGDTLAGADAGSPVPEAAVTSGPEQVTQGTADEPVRIAPDQIAQTEAEGQAQVPVPADDADITEPAPAVQEPAAPVAQAQPDAEPAQAAETAAGTGQAEAAEPVAAASVPAEPVAEAAATDGGAAAVQPAVAAADQVPVPPAESTAADVPAGETAAADPQAPTPEPAVAAEPALASDAAAEPVSANPVQEAPVTEAADSPAQGAVPAQPAGDATATPVDGTPEAHAPHQVQGPQLGNAVTADAVLAPPQQPQSDGQAPQAATPAPAGPQGESAAAPVPDPAVAADGTQAPGPEQPLGEFVPVEGSVPTTPHLAPTPPHPIVLPAQETPGTPGTPETPQVPETAATAETPEVPQGPVATVPAPREAEAPGSPAQVPAPAAPETEPAVDVVQQAEDLDTRGAEPEESAAAVAEAQQPAGPAAPAYGDAEREAVLKVMRERRDIRNGFRGDPIPHEVLLRVLEAAHTAPSVGHSQPWDFVVIRSADTRRTMHELATRQREAYAKSLPKGRAKQFKELKIEAILDTPVNIVVTADPTRGGRHTLGRHTQPQMAPYSSALAVENLWLAARAEGLGVGWVSFFDEREMVRALGLPEHLEVVAYLCVGYVDEFPDEPELMQAGWSKRRPLSWVVHEETYGRRALPGEDPHDLLAETVAQIRPLDAKALGEAWERQKRMTKPAGALGMLEIISAQLSGLSRQCPPPIPEPAAVAIFAGDHGVHAQGVTPWPQEVTSQMVANFLGGGAVCNAFANQVGAEVCVVDVGVAGDLPATPGLLPRKIRGGTSDMTTGPAMSREEVKQAIEVGIETARDLVAAGNKALLTGEMGIANTTASAALISVFTGADPAEVTGRGTGINDETLARKTEVVRRALELHQPDPADPIGVLAAVGGFEHAAIVGLLLGGASLRTPVILDGVSAGAAALVARAIAPEALAACIAGHRSAEPGHVAALNKLGLRPLVDLDLRLGEGTGALLALPLVQSTARAMHEVATFDSAGVTEK